MRVSETEFEDTPKGLAELEDIAEQHGDGLRLNSVKNGTHPNSRSTCPNPKTNHPNPKETYPNPTGDDGFPSEKDGFPTKNNGLRRRKSKGERVDMYGGDGSGDMHVLKSLRGVQDGKIRSILDSLGRRSNTESVGRRSNAESTGRRSSTEHSTAPRLGTESIGRYTSADNIGCYTCQEFSVYSGIGRYNSAESGIGRYHSAERTFERSTDSTIGRRRSGVSVMDGRRKSSISVTDGPRRSSNFDPTEVLESNFQTVFIHLSTTIKSLFLWLRLFARPIMQALTDGIIQPLQDSIGDYRNRIRPLFNRVYVDGQRMVSACFRTNPYRVCRKMFEGWRDGDTHGSRDFHKENGTDFDSRHKLPWITVLASKPINGLRVYHRGIYGFKISSMRNNSMESEDAVYNSICKKMYRGYRSILLRCGVMEMHLERVNAYGKKVESFGTSIKNCFLGLLVSIFGSGIVGALEMPNAINPSVETVRLIPTVESGELGLNDEANNANVIHSKKLGHADTPPPTPRSTFLRNAGFRSPRNSLRNRESAEGGRIGQGLSPSDNQASLNHAKNQTDRLGQTILCNHDKNIAAGRKTEGVAVSPDQNLSGSSVDSPQHDRISGGSATEIGVHRIDVSACRSTIENDPAVFRSKVENDSGAFKSTSENDPSVLKGSPHGANRFYHCKGNPIDVRFSQLKKYAKWLSKQKRHLARTQVAGTIREIAVPSRDSSTDTGTRDPGIQNGHARMQTGTDDLGRHTGIDEGSIRADSSEASGGANRTDLLRALAHRRNVDVYRHEYREHVEKQPITPNPLAQHDFENSIMVGIKTVISTVWGLFVLSWIYFLWETDQFFGRSTRMETAFVDASTRVDTMSADATYPVDTNITRATTAHTTFPGEAASEKLSEIRPSSYFACIVNCSSYFVPWSSFFVNFMVKSLLIIEDSDSLAVYVVKWAFLSGVTVAAVYSQRTDWEAVISSRDWEAVSRDGETIGDQRETRRIRSERPTFLGRNTRDFFLRRYRRRDYRRCDIEPASTLPFIPEDWNRPHNFPEKSTSSSSSASSLSWKDSARGSCENHISTSILPIVSRSIKATFTRAITTFTWVTLGGFWFWICCRMSPFLVGLWNGMTFELAFSATFVYYLCVGGRADSF